MTISLAAIRAKLQSAQAKNSYPTSDAAIFPFWNIQTGETATVRFLPDGNDENTFFWVESRKINLPFSGTSEDPHTARTISIPCAEMWGLKCPVLEETRPMWKDSTLQDTARKYWPKKSYIMQGLVVESSLDEKETPNPIRRFVLNQQIFKIIQDFCMDPDVEYAPIDYKNGRDFKLKKTKQGEWASYTTSSFSLKERALSDSELRILKENELFDLAQFLPNKPSDEDLRDFAAMFEASLNQEVLDLTKFGKWVRDFKPQTSAEPKTVKLDPVLAKAAAEEPREEMFEIADKKEEKQSTNKAKAHDVLAQLAARTKKKA